MLISKLDRSLTPLLSDLNARPLDGQGLAPASRQPTPTTVLVVLLFGSCAWSRFPKITPLLPPVMSACLELGNQETLRLSTNRNAGGPIVSAGSMEEGRPCSRRAGTRLAGVCPLPNRERRAERGFSGPERSAHQAEKHQFLHALRVALSEGGVARAPRAQVPRAPRTEVDREPWNIAPLRDCFRRRHWPLHFVL